MLHPVAAAWVGTSITKLIRSNGASFRVFTQSEEAIAPNVAIASFFNNVVQLGTKTQD